MRALSLASIIIILSLLAGCEPTGPGQTTLRESYEHVRAAWSPDGFSLAFTADIGNVLGIYVVDTSGANIRLVHAGDALGLSWSPDGQYIAYSQQSQIYRVAITLDNPELLVPQATSIRPSWSPDGSRIAYVLLSNGLRTFRVSTGEDVQIYPFGTYPSWRPDGSTILAYEETIDNATGGNRYTIYTVHADSLLRSDIFALITLDDCAFFSMSPDGEYLVFSRKPQGSYAQIRRISLFTRAEVGLTTDAGDHPAISPDGQWIVCTRTVEGDGGLWLMRMDGSEKRRVTAP